MNKVFKDRLFETGKSLLLTLVALIGMALFVGAAAGFFWLLDWIWTPLDDFLVFVVFGLFMLVWLYRGAKWLFIEPFLKKSDDDDK